MNKTFIKVAAEQKRCRRLRKGFYGRDKKISQTAQYQYRHGYFRCHFHLCLYLYQHVFPYQPYPSLRSKRGVFSIGQALYRHCPAGGNRCGSRFRRLCQLLCKRRRKSCLRRLGLHHLRQRYHRPEKPDCGRCYAFGKRTFPVKKRRH